MSQPTPYPRVHRISRLWPLVSGGIAVVLVIVLGFLVSFRASPYEPDADVLGELVEHRSPFWDVPAHAMDFLGGGWFGVFVVPIGVAVALIVARKRWSALFFVLASVLSAGTVQLLKNLFDRPRPEQILVAADFGSFPSGHVANAATISVVLALILWRRWVWFVGAAWTLLMIASRTYLGAHWLSDTIGGLLLGAAVAGFVWAPLALRLRKEWSRDTSPDSVAA